MSDIKIKILQLYKDLLLKKAETLSKAPIQSDNLNFNLSTVLSYIPQTLRSGGKHSVKEIGILPNASREIFGRVEQSPANGKKVYHHIIEDEDGNSTFHTLSLSPELNQRPLSAIHVNHYKDSPSWDGYPDVNLSSSDYHGFGLGQKIYEEAIKHHGKLKSSSSISGAANKTWEKILSKPEFSGNLGQIGSKDDSHKAEYIGDQQKKLAANELEKANIKGMPKNPTGPLEQKEPPFMSRVSREALKRKQEALNTWAHGDYNYKEIHPHPKAPAGHKTWELKHRNTGQSHVIFAENPQEVANYINRQSPSFKYSPFNKSDDLEKGLKGDWKKEGYTFKHYIKNHLNSPYHRDDMDSHEIHAIDPKGEVVGKSESNQYPLADRNEWYGDANYEQNGGKLIHMTPDEFLSQASPLEIDEIARDNIDSLKEHIKSGKTLDPLALYDTDKYQDHDGRHRAIAAKELGIEKVPVINFRVNKAEILQKNPIIDNSASNVSIGQDKEGNLGLSYRHIGSIKSKSGNIIHKFSDSDDKSGRTIFAITKDGKINSKPISTLEVDNQGESGVPQSKLAWTHENHRGKGLNYDLHVEAVNHFGELESDSTLSPASNSLWNKMKRDKSIKVDLAPIEEGDPYENNIENEDAFIPHTAYAKFNKSEDSFEGSDIDQTIYIACDGDNIGASVERAAMKDDVNEIRKQSSLIQKGQDLIEKWAKDHEGEVYIYGGDDVSFMMPKKYITKLNELKDKYKEITGYTITIGVGETVSNAGHAMLWGKLNGKNQINEWSKRIQEELDQSNHGQTPEEKLKEEGLIKSDLDLDCFFDTTLQKSDRPSRAGERHPEYPRIAKYHAPGFLAWYSDDVQANKDDSFVKNNLSNFLNKVPESHKDTVSKFINKIQTHPKRHAIPGWDPIGGKQVWSPRIRHIKHLIGNNENVGLEYNNDGSIDFNILERHGSAKDGTSWNYHPKNGLNFLGRILNGVIQKSSRGNEGEAWGSLESKGACPATDLRNLNESNGRASDSNNGIIQSIRNNERWTDKDLIKREKDRNKVKEALDKLRNILESKDDDYEDVIIPEHQVLFHSTWRYK